MRDRDLAALEFDKVLLLLANNTVSSAGREACLDIRPQTVADQVHFESERTWQFFRLLEEHLSLPLREFPDIRPALQWAAQVGASLEGSRLLEVLEVVVAVARPVHVLSSPSSRARPSRRSAEAVTHLPRVGRHAAPLS